MLEEKVYYKFKYILEKDMNLKKKKIVKVLIIVSIIILSVLAFLYYKVYKEFSGPSVGWNEKRNVSNFVENYLTNKYGDIHFKITGVVYDFKMETLFDYSKKEGYLVTYKCDELESAVSVKGIYPNISGISDWFLEKYYYTDRDKNSLATFEIFQEMNDRAPKDKIKSAILNKIKSEFDANIQEVDFSDYNVYFEIPDDFGRIPTIDEIKNDLNLYWASKITYTTTIENDKEEEYEAYLKAYLNNNFGEDWKIYINKQDNLYRISCNGNTFNVGDVLNH